MTDSCLHHILDETNCILAKSAEWTAFLAVDGKVICQMKDFSGRIRK